jgi:hypothetical protein
MAVPHRLILIVAAACLTTMTAGVVIGHYAIPSSAKSKPSARDGGFYVSARQSAAAQAVTNVRAAVPALEAWNADRGVYTGATLNGLRTKYDYGLKDVRVVFATADDYCLESRVGDAVASKHGQAGAILPQPCS